MKYSSNYFYFIRTFSHASDQMYTPDENGSGNACALILHLRKTAEYRVNIAAVKFMHALRILGVCIY